MKTFGQSEALESSMYNMHFIFIRERDESAVP